MKQWTIFLMAVILVGSSVAVSASEGNLQDQVQALQKRVAELEAQQNGELIAQRNAELIRQMISEVAGESGQFAQDTGITAGYDKRFFIKSSDDQFKLGIDTLLQFRHSYLLANDGDELPGGADPSANGIELERARIKLVGHVLKDLKYMIQMEMDDESDLDNGNNAYLLDYVLSYSFMPELGIRVGRFKGAFSKQYNADEGRFMLIDRSLATTVFHIGRSTGVELFGACPVADTNLHYRVGIANGFRDARNISVVTNDAPPVIAGRLVLPLMGATPADFSNESDLMFHENPVLQVGCSMAYCNNRDEDHVAGGDGNLDYAVLVKSMSDGRSNRVFAGGEVSMVGADVSMKCQGLSLTLEGFYQHADLDSSEATVGLADINGYEIDNFGWYAQAGYFIVPKSLELVSRVSGICVDKTNDMYEYAGGVNWYLAGQDLKLSVDATYVDDMPVTMDTGTNFVGAQNESLFMVRTQLQFQF